MQEGAIGKSSVSPRSWRLGVAPISLWQKCKALWETPPRPFLPILDSGLEGFRPFWQVGALQTRICEFADLNNFPTITLYCLRSIDKDPAGTNA